MHPSMVVMKFGGTSVGSAEQIHRVAVIVRRNLESSPLLVVSALSGVTHTLGQAAVPGANWRERYDSIRLRHANVMIELGLDPTLVDGELGELEEVLTGISWLQECTMRTLDLVLSFGERMSARIVAASLESAGIPSLAVAAYDLGIRTTDHHGSARPLPEVEAGILAAYGRLPHGVPVVTGFIGKNLAGAITTMGRGGSDYTATIIGAALGAEEVQIWTDVSGVMTADPSVVPDALSLEALTYDEASELAYYGAQVLHPSTMTPARRRGTPIRVLNTMEPAHPGTLILPPEQVDSNPRLVKSIVYKENQILLHVTAPRRLQMHGFLARMFDVLDRFGVVVDMISTSEVTVSMTVSAVDLDTPVAELRTFADVSITQNRAIMCCVGRDMKHAVGLSGRIFGCLGVAGVNVQMISQGASEINVAFVIEDTDIGRAVRALHREFFQ